MIKNLNIYLPLIFLFCSSFFYSHLLGQSKEVLTEWNGITVGMKYNKVKPILLSMCSKKREGILYKDDPFYYYRRISFYRYCDGLFLGKGVFKITTFTKGFLFWRKLKSLSLHFSNLDNYYEIDKQLSSLSLDDTGWRCSDVTEYNKFQVCSRRIGKRSSKGEWGDHLFLMTTEDTDPDPMFKKEQKRASIQFCKGSCY